MTLSIKTKIIVAFISIWIILASLIFLAFYSRNILYHELLNLYNIYHLKVLSSAMVSLDRVVSPHSRKMLRMGEIFSRRQMRHST